MEKNAREQEVLYNLEGGQRYLICKDGEVRAVAPGLRLVEATDQEKREYQGKNPPKKQAREYGLPV